MDKLLTTNELADKLGVHRTTIYNMRKNGMPVIMAMGAPRFNYSEVIEWMKGEAADNDKQW